MNEKQVRKLVKTAYDKAMMDGKCGFGIDELEGWNITVRNSVIGDSRNIYLNFPGGWITLQGKSFPRSVIIDIFAEYIWNWNKE